MWIKVEEDLPEFNRMVCVLCDDYMGDYEGKASRVEYKQPRKKGGRKGWRWVSDYGKTLGRKEAPSAWKHM